MLSSPRARRELPASGPESGVAAGRKSGRRPLFAGLFGLFKSKPPELTVADPNANALLAFPSEAARSDLVPISDVATQPAPRSSRRSGQRLVRPLIALVALVAVSGLTLIAIRLYPRLSSGAAVPETGKLTIDTRLVSSEVLIDGERRGMTPLTLALAPGAHTVTVRTGSDERVVPVTIAAGADVAQYFDMKAAEPAAILGQVSITTDPSGARVAIDGQPRGISPLTVADLTADEHRVTVTSAAGSAERSVIVTAGGTASLVFSLAKASGPVGGWLSISSPFEVQVAENADVVGTSGASRIMLAAGHHSVTLTNRSLGYQESRKIEVTAGKTTAIRVDAPKASISVNARPWAEIVLDGNSLGQTPIANVQVSLGPHEIVFKHPQLGERKQTVVVTVQGPNRMAADLTK